MDLQTVCQLGEGSYGQVYLVRLSQDHSKQYAMKLISLNGVSERQVTSIQRELDILKALRHNNVVRFKMAMLDEGKSQLKILMEFADQGDLGSRIAAQRQLRTPFKFVQVSDWFYQLVTALEFIHHKKILHRDLKPCNVLLKTGCNCCPGCERPAVKIADFGVSTILCSENDYQAETVIGTPYYLSPEICNGQAYDYKSDMWSLGCMMYELLTLSPPFTAPCIESLMLRILCGKFDKLSIAVPPALTAPVHKLLNNDPASRPSAAMLKKSLEVSLESAAFHKTPLVPTLQRNPRGRDRTRSVAEEARHLPATPEVKKELRYADVSDDSGYLTPEMDSPRAPPQAGGDETLPQKIDTLLTWLEKSLGSQAFCECYAVYRQTTSLSRLKQSLGSANVMFAASLMQLVFLEDKSFNNETSS